MTEPSKSKKKAPRKKATTDIGRQLLQRQRQILAKEEAAQAEQFVQEARERAAAQRRVENNPMQAEEVAFNRGVVRRVAGVLASERVNVPIHAARSETLSAYTDFNKIVVQYRLKDDIRLSAAVLRGLLYHEGGHVRFTIPFITLQDMVREELGGNQDAVKTHGSESVMHKAWNALEDQRMETAVTSDSPRKAAYFAPMILTELTENAGKALANYPLLIWRRYLPKNVRAGARALFVAMYSEQMALDIETTVDKYVRATDVVTMWEAVYEMAVLLERCPPDFDLHDYSHARQGQPEHVQGDQDRLSIPIRPDMLEEDEEEVDGALDTDEGRDDDSLSAPGSPGEEGDESDEEGSKGAESDEDDSDEDDSDEKGEDEGEGEGSKGDKPFEHRSEYEAERTASDDEGDHDEALWDEDDFDPDTFQSTLEEAIKNAEEERYADTALDDDVAAYEEAKWAHDSNLIPYIPGVEEDGLLMAEADNLAYEIEQTFQANSIDRAPAWVEQQPRGALNVLRYVTREPGNREVFRSWVDDDQPGYDIAVTVLLDYSMSMDAERKRLAQAGYACKVGCDKLNIPCTVVLWDTDARALWYADDRADFLPTITVAGGTNPLVALQDIDNHRYDREKHLVLIFTDGAWDSSWESGYEDHSSRGKKGVPVVVRRNLHPYKDQGRFIIGFGYGSERLAQGLLGKGCDEAYAITDLLDIPRRLEVALIDHS